MTTRPENINVSSIMGRYVRPMALLGAVLLAAAALADNGAVDSLEKVIKYSKYNIARADAYVSLSEIVYTSNIDSVIPLCTTAIDMLEVDLTDTSLKARRRIMDIKAHALNNIGAVYYQKGNLSKAIDFYLEGLKLRETLDDKQGIAESYNNLGLVYKVQGDILQAIAYYQKSLKLYDESGDVSGQATATGNIGALYATGNNAVNALPYFQKMYKLEDSLRNIGGMVEALYNIAVVYHDEGKSEDALKICFQGLDLLAKIDDPQHKANFLYLIADIEYEENNDAEAGEYGTKALQAWREIGFPDMIRDAANLMFKIYRDKKQWKEALNAYLLYSDMRDSVNNGEMRKENIKKEMQYEYDKRVQQDKAAQERKDLIRDAESKRQTFTTILALIIAVSTGAIAVLIFRSLRTTRKQKLIIEEQKTLVEEKNKDILDSITYAKRLQDAILPPMSLIEYYFPESFVLYKPKDIVAGDFYWAAPPLTGGGAGAVLIAACDCTGHGVPGALVSVVCSNSLNRAVREFNLAEPGKILDKTAELVIETFSQKDMTSEGQTSASSVKDGMDASLIAMKRQSSGTTEIEWAGANNPLWVLRNGEIIELKADSQPIGHRQEGFHFTTRLLTLEKGDVIYLFTDGFADQFGGPDDKKFKYGQMRKLIKSLNGIGMKEQKAALDIAFENWKGTRVQTDDVCIIGLKV